jgi:hypothetical protein
VLLNEAQWARTLYEEASAQPFSARGSYVSNAHYTASLSPASGQDRQVHELFMSNPLPPLQTVYADVFQRILGQQVSKAGPRLVQAEQLIERAKRSGRPILFVLHEGEWWQNPVTHGNTLLMMKEFFVIPMPLREAPALSQLTKQPPYESDSNGARPLFVVTNSDCEQIRSFSGWNEASLIMAMAEGWADALERNPPDVRTLVRAQRILRNAHAHDSLHRVRELTIRRQKQKEDQNLKTASL